MIRQNCKHVDSYGNCNKKPKRFFGMVKPGCVGYENWVGGLPLESVCGYAEKHERPQPPNSYNKTNKYEKACREWLDGCSCVIHGDPEECEECTKAFLKHIKSIMKTEWHIFTHDGNEYIGSRLKYEEECMVLFRKHKVNYSGEVRDWSCLWLAWKEVKWQEEVETYDYIIPIKEVLRVERHDVSDKDTGV